MARISTKNASIVAGFAHAFATLGMLGITTMMDETAEDMRALMMSLIRELRAMFANRPASYREEVTRILGSGRVAAGEERIEGIAPAEYRAQLDDDIATLETESGETIPADVVRAARNGVNDYVSKARAIAKAAADPAFNLDVTFWEAYQQVPKTETSNRKGKGKRKAAEVKGMSVREFAAFVREQASTDRAHYLALLECVAKMQETTWKDPIHAEAVRAIARNVKAAA